jgi:hypothetical protein
MSHQNVLTGDVEEGRGDAMSIVNFIGLIGLGCGVAYIILCQNFNVRREAINLSTTVEQGLLGAVARARGKAQPEPVPPTMREQFCDLF